MAQFTKKDTIFIQIGSFRKSDSFTGWFHNFEFVVPYDHDDHNTEKFRLDGTKIDGE